MHVNRILVSCFFSWHVLRYSDTMALANGHFEPPEELAEMLADEPPHPTAAPSKSVANTVPIPIYSVDINQATLADIEHDKSHSSADPDELIRSHDPEHVCILSDHRNMIADAFSLRT